MTFREDDRRALGVLAGALQSTSRITRLRAVSMLARVQCADRMRWLEVACADSDEAVATTAQAVLSWVVEPPEPPWPQREDPCFDRVAPACGEPVPPSGANTSRWKWEYVVEIWREDGLLVGAYFASTCAEDDDHAKRIALGQAILANSGKGGDSFDAATAAAFIVGKRYLPGPADESNSGERDPGSNRTV